MLGGVAAAAAAAASTNDETNPPNEKRLLSSPLHVHTTEVALHDSDIHYDRVTPSIWWKMPSGDPVAFENGKSAASRQFLRTHRVSHSYCRTQHSTRDSIGEEEDHNGEERRNRLLGLCSLFELGAWALGEMPAF